MPLSTARPLTAKPQAKQGLVHIADEHTSNQQVFLALIQTATVTASAHLTHGSSCNFLLLFLIAFILTMSLNHDRLAGQSLQSATQQALYRAGRLKLNAQFEPWSDSLQQAIETAALYGLAINAAEAEAALECLFEINPQSCWQLLCSDFAPEYHAALVRGLLCDRYQWLLLSFRPTMRSDSWPNSGCCGTRTVACCLGRRLGQS
jgi:hypothetical protein